MSWQHEGKAIPKSCEVQTTDKDTTVSISKVKREESGVYSLTVSNESGKDTASINVSVIGRLPSFINFSRYVWMSRRKLSCVKCTFGL